MTSLSGLRVVVAGAGALGSAVALQAQRAGAQVILADPAALGDNASGVAAGMLAPAFEAVLDPVSAGHFDLYREARDLWPDFAAGLGAAPERCGALWVARDAADLDAMAGRLQAVGAEVRALSSGAAQALSPGLAAPHGGALTPEDWRLEPAWALDALRAAFERAGGRRRPTRLLGLEAGRAWFADGEAAADAVVLASGLAPEGFAGAPAELAALSPIKGQILKAQGHGPRAGPVIRAAGIYVVPGAEGPWIGATMEAGARDRRTDEATAARLAGLASGLFSALAEAPASASAAVRAATPDGLPLVGCSSRPGVLLAMGARRNGWLLAPLVAGAVVESLAGGEAPARLRPDRFDLARVS